MKIDRQEIKPVPLSLVEYMQAMQAEASSILLDMVREGGLGEDARIYIKTLQKAPE